MSPHEWRNPARNGTAGLIFAAFLACLSAFSAVTPLRAGITELVVSDDKGIALYGFDPVAFFIDQAPRRGLASLEAEHAGAVFRFCNEGNRAAFRANPETYVPRYGGYDPVAVGRGAPAAGLPHFFVIRQNQLYFFADEKNRARFLANPQEALAAAEVEWPRVTKGLVH